MKNTQIHVHTNNTHLIHEQGEVSLVIDQALSINLPIAGVTICHLIETVIC